MAVDRPHDKKPLPLARSLTFLSLKNRCPKCGVGHIYAGMLALKERCPNPECELSFENADTADGPAFFVITIMGALIVLLPAMLELISPSPLWVHLTLWVPLVGLGSLWMLRLFKSGLVALQYKHHLLEEEGPT
jgi:uncharacterized protein (DUF983 family)